MGAFGKIIGATAGLGSSLMSAAFNHKLAEKSAKAQYDRQLDFWQKQNAYNDPAAQRDRLQAAGFNPNAALGQIAGNQQAGGLSSVPGNEYAQGGVFKQETFSEALRMFSELKSVNLDNEYTQRQIQLSYLEEMIQQENLTGLELSNEEKRILLQTLEDEQYQNLQQAIEDVRTSRLENDRREEDNAAYREYRAAGGNQYMEQRNLTDAQIRGIQSDIDSSLHSNALTDAQRDYYQGMRDLLTFQTGTAALDFTQRQQEVSEFLDEDNVRYRQFAREVQDRLIRYAGDQAKRQEDILQLTDEYDRQMAQHLVDAAEGNDFDALLLDYLYRDPGSVFGILGQLGDLFEDDTPPARTINHFHHH